MTKKGQKFIGLILIASIVLPVFALNSKKVQAQPFVPVHDAISLTTISGLLSASNLISTQTAIATGGAVIKEVGAPPGTLPLAQAVYNPGTGVVLAPTSLDFVGVTMAKLVIEALTNSIVGWINAGFPSGGPAFIRDPGSFFADLADAIAGDFIEGSELGFLCDPFQLDIRLALNIQYQSTFEDKITCRLTDVLKNIENFAKFTGDSGQGVSADFFEGGWSGFVSLTRQNQYSTYLDAQAELSARITGRQNIELLQLNWGDGFLSFQECLEPAGAPLSECVVKGPIKTPGKVIETGLGNVLGTELTELELADSIDKIIAALLNQLISQALSGNGLIN